MPLYLIESPIAADPAGLDPLFGRIVDAVERAGGEVIELQVGLDTSRLYIVAEHRQPEPLEDGLRDAFVPFSAAVEVRLVGPSLDEVKAARSAARYLVEWDLPAGLSMEQYLHRKREKAPRYAQVPETTFLRTYVCSDMSKCLCLYNAPDEAAVLRARAAVETPVDRVTRIEEAGPPCSRLIRHRERRSPTRASRPSSSDARRTWMPVGHRSATGSRTWRSWGSWDA